jgi:hypothetical protein
MRIRELQFASQKSGFRSKGGKLVLKISALTLESCILEGPDSNDRDDITEV